MTSALRTKISKKILSPISRLLEVSEHAKLPFLLPKSLKLQKFKDDVPKFEISWKQLVKLKPDLEQRLHPDTLFTLLKEQNYPIEEGIDYVYEGEGPQRSYIFSVNQQIFTKGVLRELSHNFNDLSDRSTFFCTIPKDRVVIDFSSPNIAKPFHYGHFRSTIIGNFIANICRFLGHDVVTINYIGDWGLQYGILASGYKIFGNEDKLMEDPLMHLYSVYQQANERANENPEFAEAAKLHFRKMENGDADSLFEWKKFKDLSLNNLEKTYEDLGIRFDEIHCESMYAEKAADILKTLEEKNIAFHESDGSIQAVIRHNDDSEEKVVLRKSDGTSLYLTRDITAAVDRRNKYRFDTMYYVVDSTQHKHFSHLFYLLKQMGCPWHENLHHIPFGRILKFSSRKGNAVFLQDILSEAQEKTLERMKNSQTTKVTENVEETAYVLGVSSLIVNDLSKHRKKDYSFDWDKILSMTGDSGITLQYCHSRLNNIKANCGIDLNVKCDLSLLVEPEAVALVHHLARFDEAILHSYENLEPCILVHYLFELKHAVGRANKTLTVKGRPLPIAKARLLLFHTSQLVMAKGLELLGIRPLNKM